MATVGNPHHDSKTGKFTTGTTTTYTGAHPEAQVHFQQGSIKLVQTPGKRNVRYQIWNGDHLVEEIPASMKWRSELRDMTVRAEQHASKPTGTDTSSINQAIREQTVRGTPAVAPAAAKPVAAAPAAAPVPAKPAAATAAKTAPAAAPAAAKPAATSRNLPAAKNVTLTTDKGTPAVQKRLFKRTLSNEEMVGMVGALDGANVEVTSSDFAGVNKLHITVKHAGGIQERSISRDDLDKKLVCENLSASLLVPKENMPRGTQAVVLARQVAELEQLGVARIHTTALLPDSHRLASLGYDAPLPASLRKELPEHLQQHTTFRTLHSTDDGIAWWQRNGQPLRLSFSVAKGSPDRAALGKYLQSLMRGEA